MDNLKWTEQAKSTILSAIQQIQKGNFVFFKWTCIGCQSRQTFDKLNTFFVRGICEECKVETNLAEDESANVNYMLLASATGDNVADILKDIADRQPPSSKVSTVLKTEDISKLRAMKES